jgi:hypothetical protein
MVNKKWHTGDGQNTGGKTNTAVNQSARTVCPGKGSSGSQGVRTFKEDRK